MGAQWGGMILSLFTLTGHLLPSQTQPGLGALSARLGTPQSCYLLCPLPSQGFSPLTVPPLRTKLCPVTYVPNILCKLDAVFVFHVQNALERESRLLKDTQGLPGELEWTSLGNLATPVLTHLQARSFLFQDTGSRDSLGFSH